MEEKKSNLILGISMALVFIITVGISYAFFSAKLTGLENASTLTLIGGRMEIDYEEGANIELAGIYPKNEAWATKNFTLTGNNDTTKEMKYKVGLIIEENEFSEESLTYSLTNTLNQSGTPIDNVEESPIIKTSGTQYIGYGLFSTAENKKHSYELKIYFKNNNEEQSENMGAKFKAKITVEECLDDELITVTFNADGGILANNTKTVLANGVYGNLPTPTKEGYEFLGWNGKNMFNLDDYMNFYSNYQSIKPEKVFFDGKYVWKMYGFMNSEGRNYRYMDGQFKENTQYTITLWFYDVPFGTIGGVFPFVVYSDNTYQYFIAEELNAWAKTNFTTKDDKSLSYLKYNYGTGSAYSYIREWQIEEGTEATPYEPYYITKDLNIVQNQDHTLKAIWKEVS